VEKLLLALLVLGSITLSSCSKSDGNSNVSPLDKQYKSLTSDNVNSFFIETSRVYKGCAGANCQSIYNFSFKNLSYVSEISRIGLVNTSPSVLWNY